jgi:hypothetical protein
MLGVSFFIVMLIVDLNKNSTQHDIENNDIQHKGSKHNGILYKDTELNNIKPTNTKHNPRHKNTHAHTRSKSRKTFWE